MVRFFFQAEDGIRELVRSRGLGDVYKRQLGDREGARGIADARGPARGEHAADRHAEHERGEHQRARPHGVAQQAAERAEPQHLEEQRRHAGGEEGEGQAEGCAQGAGGWPGGGERGHRPVRRTRVRRGREATSAIGAMLRERRSPRRCEEAAAGVARHAGGERRVGELEFAQLGRGTVEPEDAGDIGALALARGGKGQAVERGARAYTRHEPEAVRGQELLGEEDVGVGGVVVGAAVGALHELVLHKSGHPAQEVLQVYGADGAAEGVRAGDQRVGHDAAQVTDNVNVYVRENPGKSILIEALNLVLGGRASVEVIRTGADAATVEAVVEYAGVVRAALEAFSATGGVARDAAIEAVCRRAKATASAPPHGR